MLSVVTLGVGAGKTTVFDGECSSAFLLCIDGTPVLLLDAGLGVTAAALRQRRRLPDHIYVSHNHTDHAGELPVLLSVESARRTAAGQPPLSVLAERSVLQRLKDHRLHELLSTGHPLESFGRLVELEEGHRVILGVEGLAMTPLRARHAEVAFGLLIEHRGSPVLGWTSDSGFCPALLSKLAAAPVVLMDAREGGTPEHAGFDQVTAAASTGCLQHCSVYVYGYGRVDEAPSIRKQPELYAVAKVLRPGDEVFLGPRFDRSCASDEQQAGTAQELDVALRQ